METEYPKGAPGMRICVVLSLVFLISFELSAAEVVDVASRGEVTRVLVEAGDDPSVAVVLFAGGPRACCGSPPAVTSVGSAETSWSGHAATSGGMAPSPR
jgi:hypothetical protein